MALPVPNELATISAVKQRWPQAFRLCHRDYGTGQGQPGKTTRAQAELFIRLAAWECHKRDPKWGLNGKRGHPNDLSQDALNYRYDATRRQGVDIVHAAGIDSASVTWNVFAETGTDATGHWIQPREIPQAEIDHVLAGGNYQQQPAPPPIPPPPPPTGPTITIAQAFTELDAVFRSLSWNTARRGWTGAEQDAIIARAQALGFLGHPTLIALAIVEQIKVDMQAYNPGGAPLPPAGIDPNHALALIQQHARSVLPGARELTKPEIDRLIVELQRQGLDLSRITDQILHTVYALVTQYAAAISEQAAPPVVVPPVQGALTIHGPGFLLNGQPFDWRGITAFLLFYDFCYRRPRFDAFVQACVTHKVTVPRISVATSTEYLSLRPKSGGTYGGEMAAPLHPGNVADFWGKLRACIRTLNQHGMVPEVVPFLTVGPNDASVPGITSESGRMAYLDTFARELLPERLAFGEVANEYNFIGFSSDGHEIKRLWDRWKHIDPARPIAMSAPSGPGDTQNARFMAQGDYITVHPDRKTSPHTFSWILHMVGLPQRDPSYGKPVVNDESINADNEGEYGNDPDHANSWAAGLVVRLIHMHYTFHYDGALKGLPPAASNRSLPCIQAWREGLDDLPFAYPGTFFGAQGSQVTPGSPFPNSGKAVAVLGHWDGAQGHCLFLGTQPGFSAPHGCRLIKSKGTHGLFALSK